MKVLLTRFIARPVGGEDIDLLQKETRPATLENILSGEDDVFYFEEDERGDIVEELLIGSEIKWLPMSAQEAFKVLPETTAGEALWELRTDEGSLLGVGVDALSWTNLRNKLNPPGAGLEDALADGRVTQYSSEDSRQDLESQERAVDVYDFIQALGLFVPQDAGATEVAREELFELGADGQLVGLKEAELEGRKKTLRKVRNRARRAASTPAPKLRLIDL